MMRLNKYYGHFLLLMILVVILITSFAYTHTTEAAAEAKKRLENEKFILSVQPDHLPIEKVVEHMIYGIYEAALVPTHSKPDEYTRYNVWYSYMIRRGVPEAYITQDVYEKIHSMPPKVTPKEIEGIIRPIFEKEQQRVANLPKPAPFQPVCLNY